MDCPHCKKPVSIFSRHMTRFAKVRSCPHCRGPVRQTFSFKTMLMWGIPLMILAQALKLWLGLGIGITAVFLAGVAMTLLAARLERAA